MWLFFTEKYMTSYKAINNKILNDLITFNLSWFKRIELLEVNYSKKNFINFFIKSKPLIFKSNLSLFFTNFFLRNGLTLKILQYFQYAFTKLYNSIFEDVENKKKNFINFIFIFNMLSLNINFFNINTFFFFITKLLTYSFYFKVVVLPKFLKKKLKIKYSIEPTFLEKKKRYKTTLKILSNSIDGDKSFFFKNRLFNSFKDLAFNSKKSIFFLEKSSTYLKIFKLLKKKKNFKSK